MSCRAAVVGFSSVYSTSGEKLDKTESNCEVFGNEMVSMSNSLLVDVVIVLFLF